MAFKILIVDDEPDLEILVRQKFRKKIRDGEFAFVFAQNGREALDKLAADEDIDIVMSDINMPVMDGLTLLSHLTDINRILKTVIVSAYGDMQNIRTAMNRGAYDFLTKPIDFDDFEATINKTLQELSLIRQGLKARQRLDAIQNELSVASRIQQSILPRTAPAFPGRSDFEIFAEMIPAREVGGDFYDFFLIDKDRLGFVIGDVSGKGVPAAIFMAVCRTLLRATALQGISAAECLQYVNGVLSKQSDPTMFVTVFYGILRTSTGELEYALGGHNPPLLFAPEGDIERLEEPACMLVGAFDQARYQNGYVRIPPGGGVLLYTDGVTEAADGNADQFSDERLAGILERVKTASVQEIIREVVGEVRSFSAGAPQSDDITMLALRLLPR